MSVDDDQVLSKRAVWTKDFPNFKREYAPKVRLNRYNPTENPKGIVDLGGAENKLCEDILLERLQQPDVNTIDPSLLYYFECHGIQRFREAVASLLNDKLHTKQPILPENMIITSGVGAALDLLAHVLVDPGEAFLSPSPYYTRIRTDVGERSQAQVISVPLAPQDKFTLTVDKLEKAYKDATDKGTRVRGIILINPHNPTGDIYPPSLLTDILVFAKSHQLHVILDEIYALSVFASGAAFHSVAALPTLPDPARTHLVWGFSKDFALSGFRVGVIHSWNSSVVSAMKPLCYLAAVPAIVQDRLCKLISDRDWLDNVYLPANTSRMRTNRAVVERSVTAMGASVHPSHGAFFVWADFTQVLAKAAKKPAPFDVFLAFFEAGLYVEPARAFYMEDSYWFRIIFTLPEPLLQEGLRRMRDVLASYCDLPAISPPELEFELDDMEVVVESQAAGDTKPGGGGESLDSLMRGLCMQLRDSDWLQQQQQGGWDKENPEAVAELRDLFSGKTTGKSLDEL